MAPLTVTFSREARWAANLIDIKQRAAAGDRGAPRTRATGSSARSATDCASSPARDGRGLAASAVRWRHGRDPDRATLHQRRLVDLPRLAARRGHARAQPPADQRPAPAGRERTRRRALGPRGRVRRRTRAADRHATIHSLALAGVFALLGFARSGPA